MSGFSETVVKLNKKNYRIEIKTLNNKRKDLSLSYPRDLQYLDFFIRSKLQKLFSRGQVHIRISLQLEKQDEENLLGIDEKMLEHFYSQYLSMKKRLKIEEGLPLDFFLNLLKSRSLTETEQQKSMDEFSKALDVGFRKLDQMKMEEGLAIYRQLKGHVKEIMDDLSLIQSLSKGSEAHYREKIEKKLLELEVLSKSDQDRIYREVIIFSDKIDITEEIERLRSHCHQFMTKIDGNERTLGKILEFLLQEFIREINTIGSKAQNIAITNKVLEMKSIVEKMKEQVNNVE